MNRPFKDIGNVKAEGQPVTIGSYKKKYKSYLTVIINSNNNFSNFPFWTPHSHRLIGISMEFGFGTQLHVSILRLNIFSVSHCWRAQPPARATPPGHSPWSTVPNTPRPRPGTGCHPTPPTPPARWGRCSEEKNQSAYQSIIPPNQIINHRADFKRRCPTVGNGTNLMTIQSMTCWLLQLRASCTRAPQRPCVWHSSSIKAASQL